MQAKLPTLRSVMFIGDSLGAGMQSCHLYDRLEAKGFASRLARAFGWHYASPEFTQSLSEKVFGWPAAPYHILNDEPDDPIAVGEYWGLLDIDLMKDGLKPGKRTNRDISNLSVPGFEIQNLMRTTRYAKRAEDGENPAPHSERDTWGYRLSHMNQQVLGRTTSIGEIGNALPHLGIITIGGNDLLESVTAGPYGDPDSVSRNDPDGKNPNPSNVTWDPKLCDVSLSNGRPIGSDYESLDFGEFVTTPSIFQATLWNILDNLESAYAYGASSPFRNVRDARDKPIIVISKVPDVTRIPLLLPIKAGRDNRRPVGRLPFACRHWAHGGDGAGGATPTGFMENIEYYAPLNTQGGCSNAKVSFLAIAWVALEREGSEFRGLHKTSLPFVGGKSQRDVLQGQARLSPVEIPEQYLLSDRELRFMSERQNALNRHIDRAVAENTGGRWPHIRIVCVDMNAVIKSRPNSLGPCGGIFSLDLVHPNSVGYTLLASEYIDAVNSLILADKFFGVTPSLQAWRGYVRGEE
jgi:hypothetical protein